PQKLASLNMSAAEVSAAIRSQNIEVAPGQIGQPPTSRTQSTQLPIDVIGRLTSVEEFENIVVKVGQDPPMAATKPKAPKASGGASSTGGGTTAGGSDSTGGGTTGGSANSTSAVLAGNQTDDSLSGLSIDADASGKPAGSAAANRPKLVSNGIVLLKHVVTKL